jgi:hypothetical protein
VSIALSWRTKIGALAECIEIVILVSRKKGLPDAAAAALMGFGSRPIARFARQGPPEK